MLSANPRVATRTYTIATLRFIFTSLQQAVIVSFGSLDMRLVF
jgi:hypothetical protein